MRFYRDGFIKSVFIFAWCVAFLHMTFFMASISLLPVHKHKVLIENAKKLLACSSAEEEKDAHETGENRLGTKDVPLLHNNFYHSLRDNRGIITLIKFLEKGDRPHAGHQKTYSPPPDSQLS